MRKGIWLFSAFFFGFGLFWYFQSTKAPPEAQQGFSRQTANTQRQPRVQATAADARGVASLTKKRAATTVSAARTSQSENSASAKERWNEDLRDEALARIQNEARQTFQVRYNAFGAVEKLSRGVFPLNQDIDEQAAVQAFLATHAYALFGSEALSLQKKNLVTAVDGSDLKVTTYAFSQSHQGFPVWNRSVKVLVRQEDGILQIQSDVEPIPGDLAMVRTISLSQATGLVWQRIVQLAGPTTIKTDANAVASSAQEMILATAGKAAFVYRFEVSINSQIGDYEFFIDAGDGSFRRERKISTSF